MQESELLIEGHEGWVATCIAKRSFVTVSVKTVLNGTFGILRNTILKHWSHCSSLVLDFSHAGFTV